ncbi:dihydroneopterin aldolase [Sphingomonas sp.]|jgi:dihydroneopterin aldolase|uniref:dihydroneopterin aldolase n=1 Tax=Sphingomonas sp. TaxID=28214 RepID=UPI003B3B1D97
MVSGAAYSVTVRDLPVAALIGVNADEQGRRQTLLVSVDARLDPPHPLSSLADTIDYRAVVDRVQAIAQSHVGLIEQFARLVGEDCLALGPVASVVVSVAKPDALAAGLAETTVRVDRPDSSNVLPFAPVLRAGEHVLRFAFDHDLNLHAQHQMARFLRHFAGSVRGLVLDDVAFDHQAGEWTARIKMIGRGAPRMIDSRTAARVGRKGAAGSPPLA